MMFLAVVTDTPQSSLSTMPQFFRHFGCKRKHVAGIFLCARFSQYTSWMTVEKKSAPARASISGVTAMGEWKAQ
jgi:hypothetical protein